MKKMKEIVKLCIEKYKGGNKYFHEMDNLIKYDSEILQEMLDKVEKTKFIVLSGAYEHNMVKHIKNQKKHRPYVYLSGSPRKNENVKISSTNIKKRQFKFLTGVFLDDTYFSGKTFFYCKGFVESKFNSKVNGALVAYDGCKHKQQNVDSLYRYYDYHDLNGNPL